MWPITQNGVVGATKLTVIFTLSGLVYKIAMTSIELSLYQK